MPATIAHWRTTHPIVSLVYRGLPANATAQTWALRIEQYNYSSVSITQLLSQRSVGLLAEGPSDTVIPQAIAQAIPPAISQVIPQAILQVILRVILRAIIPTILRTILPTFLQVILEAIPQAILQVSLWDRVVL